MMRKKTMIPKLKPGLLKGYHPTMYEKARHKALMGLKKSTFLSIGRRLGALSTLTKRTLPKYSKIYKKNSTWAFAKSKSGCGCGLKR